MIIEKSINVILPSYLSQYPNCAKNREFKFIRSVNSFLKQPYQNKKLIIVSDGCEITNYLYTSHFGNYSNITLISLPKQDTLSGKVRQTGINYCEQNSIICYLDSDDELIGNHLGSINEQFNTELFDFVYYDDYIASDNNLIGVRQVTLDAGKIGTSTISHINKFEYSWTDCDGYGHDWQFINNCFLKKNKNGIKIYNTGYLVHHIPNICDN